MYKITHNNFTKEKIKISGIIGLNLLYDSKSNKKICIFFDDHSNNKYCPNEKNNTMSLFISQFLDNTENNDTIMILEEPFVETNSNIKVLWEDSKHLLLFRKFYNKLVSKCSKKKICKMFPIDIRLSLFDISPDEIILNMYSKDEKYDIPLNEYFHNICYLFDIGENIKIKDSIIEFIKKIFDIYKNSLFYVRLKTCIIEFIKHYDILNNKTTIYEILKKYNSHKKFVYNKGFPFTKFINTNFIHELDKILSGIMELYSIILIILLPNENIIYYAGYYHSNNISYLLQKYYNFKLIKTFGHVDDIENINQFDIKSCIEVDKDLWNT